MFWIGDNCTILYSTGNVKNLESYLQVRHTSYFGALRSIQMFTGPLFQMKLHLQVLSNSVDFREVWNSLSNAVPGKFPRSDRHSKHNCRQDQAKFQRSRACQIIIIFNTAVISMTSHTLQDKQKFLFPLGKLPCAISSSCLCFPCLAG